MEDRKLLRRKYIAIRDAINGKQRELASQNLLKSFKQYVLNDERGSQLNSSLNSPLNSSLTSPLNSPLKKVALYLSFKNELDTSCLIEFMWQHGIQVYVPVLHPFCKGHLLFLHYTETTIMTKNRYGIDEPRLDVQTVIPLAQLDTIFTPLVSFDNQGNRLGMGGGYYDRTLACVASHNKRSTKKIDVIGLAYEAQKALSLPKATWDMPLSKVLTPSCLHRF